MRRQHLVPLLLVVLVAVASSVVAVVALDLAAGVTRPRGRCCKTEFIDTPTLGWLWLLYPLVALAAAWSWRLALLAVPGIAVPQWLAMDVVMDRYAESGWGDGLEVLGYAVPVVAAVIGVVSVWVGSSVPATFVGWRSPRASGPVRATSSSSPSPLRGSPHPPSGSPRSLAPRSNDSTSSTPTD